MNTQSDQINELVTALSKAQGEIKPALKDTSNPFFNSKYADLNSVWNSCREPLSRNNLSVIQTVDTVGENMSLITTLAHGSGQWIKSSLPIIMPKGDTEIDKYGKEKKINRLQVLGSALTYLRRYSLASIVGIASEEDDDGNSFSSMKVREERPSPKTNTNHFPDSKKIVAEQIKTDEALVENQTNSEFITENQWDELKKLISSCNEKFQSSTWGYLELQEIFTHDKMPLSLYMRIKKGCKDNVVKGDYAVSQA